MLHEDLYIRRYVKKKLYHGGIASIEIERAADQVRIKISAARPGIIIGKKGSEVDNLRVSLQDLTKKQVNIDVVEVKEPELNAQLVAENIASQIERRVAYRRAMKKSITTALHLGSQGIKVYCGGRLGGAEIARHEWYREGRLPLHTLRADIDFGKAEALTTYGLIGIKVWFFNGEVLGPERQISEATKAQIERKVKGAPKRQRTVRERGPAKEGVRVSEVRLGNQQRVRSASPGQATLAAPTSAPEVSPTPSAPVVKIPEQTGPESGSGGQA